MSTSTDWLSGSLDIYHCLALSTDWFSDRLADYGCPQTSSMEIDDCPRPRSSGRAHNDWFLYDSKGEDQDGSDADEADHQWISHSSIRYLFKGNEHAVNGHESFAERRISKARSIKFFLSTNSKEKNIVFVRDGRTRHHSKTTMF